MLVWLIEDHISTSVLEFSIAEERGEESVNIHMERMAVPQETSTNHKLFKTDSCMLFSKYLLTKLSEYSMYHKHIPVLWSLHVT